MNDIKFYWDDIPVGAENALSYNDLCSLWGKEKRAVRAILHELSIYDSGDDYILIRSAKGKGFYKTDDEATLQEYRKECLSKGRSNFAPVRKINRVLRGKSDAVQYNVFNNLKAARMSAGLSQPAVVKLIKEVDKGFDVPMLSKLENGAFLPTPYQLLKLSEIYGCKPTELVMVEQSALDIYAQI